jgi:hypothetical protein
VWRKGRRPRKIDGVAELAAPRHGGGSGGHGVAAAAAVAAIAGAAGADHGGMLGPLSG